MLSKTTTRDGFSSLRETHMVIGGLANKGAKELLDKWMTGTPNNSFDRNPEQLICWSSIVPAFLGVREAKTKCLVGVGLHGVGQRGWMESSSRCRLTSCSQTSLSWMFGFAESLAQQAPERQWLQWPLRDEAAPCWPEGQMARTNWWRNDALTL